MRHMTHHLGRFVAVGALVAAGLASATTMPAAPAAAGGTQPPIGFERWEDPGGSCGGATGVDFNLGLADIYQQYAAQMVIGLPADEPRFQQKDRRLIDIEVHADGGGLANYVYDVVWVCNAGGFALDSWLVPALTEDDLDQLDEIDDVVILDIERYPEGQEWRYSAIVQRNSGGFDWEVLVGTTPAGIQAAVRRTAGRVVDVDVVAHCPPGTLPGQACEGLRDAVVVANTGANFVQTVDVFTGFPSSSPPAQFQLTDLEAGLTNWVTPGNPFEVVDSATTADVVHSHGHDGRVVDLEVIAHPTRPVGATYTYRTVNLTNQ